MLLPPLSWFRSVACPPVPRPVRGELYYRSMASVAACYWLAWEPSKIVRRGIGPDALADLIQAYRVNCRALVSSFAPGVPLWASVSTLQADLAAGLGSIPGGYQRPRGALTYARLVHSRVYGIPFPAGASRYATWRASERYALGGQRLTLAYDATCRVDPDEIASHGDAWAFCPWSDPWAKPTEAPPAPFELAGV